MPYRRSSYGAQGTRNGVRRTARRRVGVSTRAKYQRPTARNQRSQIRSLAKMVAYNRKVIRSATAYTDWFFNANTSNITGLWFGTPLMSPNLWSAGNRQDADVLVSQNVFVRNMIFEASMNSNTKNQAVTIDMYLVTIRNNAANWTPGVGPTGILAPGLEYNDMGIGNAVALNSGIFKVLYNKQVKLFPRNNPAPDEPTLLDFSGNAFSTYRKLKANIKLNMKIRSPAGLTWKTLSQEALPPSHRVWLLWRGVSNDSVNEYVLNWGTHVTAVSQG